MLLETPRCTSCLEHDKATGVMLIRERKLLTGEYTVRSRRTACMKARFKCKRDRSTGALDDLPAPRHPSTSGFKKSRSKVNVCVRTAAVNVLFNQYYLIYTLLSLEKRIPCGGLHANFIFWRQGRYIQKNKTPILSILLR